jgi:glutamate synthase (NADPH/NADH) small chain
MQCVKVEWIAPESKELSNPMVLPGTGFKIDVDLVLIAMGFSGAKKSKLIDDLQVQTSPAGIIMTDISYRTNIAGVFVAGDAAQGASLVVKAIAEGRKAALNIIEWLNGMRPAK